MTSTYILIVAILVLGGVLGTLGDRIGTKVGKARLSLFNLRPRKTATVVTIITGSLISTSTLGILLATSGSLRQGLFELETIQKKLRIAKADIQRLNAQKSQVETELAKTRAEQASVQQRLDITNQNFQQARNQLKKISQQTTSLRAEIKSLLAERQELLQQRDQLNERIILLKALVTQRDQELAKKDQTINQRNQELAQKDQTINQRNQELDRTINERNREVAKKDQTINERNQELVKQDKVIAERESRLKELEQQLKEAISQRETRLQELEQELTQREIQLDEGEKQLAYLQQQVESLEQYYQDYQALRQGNVALVRGRVLSFGVVRIVKPSAATQAVEQLLREANRTAIEITRNNQTSYEPLVQIPGSQVEQLVNQIKDGKDYVVRILSAGNYVEGEKQVQVFADAALNQVVYQAGDTLATISADSSTMTNEEMRQRLDQLLSAAQFRARRAGILGMVQVGDGRISTIIRFIEQLDQYGQPVDVRVIVQETTYTAGPLKMQLVAIQKGQVVFKS
ncbi:MAG: DUF3084 domain-containing protein [Cyanobacteriota bacterium]|nr:DUF3084 domain-containing protein [Cyanobacteriota bacterium]